MYGLRSLENRYVAGVIAVACPLLLILGGKAGELWHLFGGTNQALAGLSLTVVTVWLYRLGRTWQVAFVPMVTLLVVSILAMVTKVGAFIDAETYLLATIGTIVVALECWVVLEAAGALNRYRRAGRPTSA